MTCLRPNDLWIFVSNKRDNSMGTHRLEVIEPYRVVRSLVRIALAGLSLVHEIAPSIRFGGVLAAKIIEDQLPSGSLRNRLGESHVPRSCSRRRRSPHRLAEQRPSPSRSPDVDRAIHGKWWSDSRVFAYGGSGLESRQILRLLGEKHRIRADPNILKDLGGIYSVYGKGTARSKRM
jgi:hypothetical protein